MTTTISVVVAFGGVCVGLGWMLGVGRRIVLTDRQHCRMAATIRKGEAVVRRIKALAEALKALDDATQSTETR